MAQADTPVRPDESDEVRALRRLAYVAGWCVTSTTGGNHSPRSLHFAPATNGRGRAVDLADRRGPSTSSTWLLEINEAIVRLLPLSMIQELIYGGPGAFCVKDGRRVDGRVVYSSVIDAHRNHVHLAVTVGFRFDVTPEVPPMPDDPTIPNIRGPIQFHPIVNADGQCTGYYFVSLSTGEVHGWGEGARFHGRSEVTA